MIGNGGGPSRLFDGRRVVVMALLGFMVCGIPVADMAEFAIDITVTSTLRFPRTPMDPKIDFGAILKEAGAPGVLDPNSIAVFDLTAAAQVPHALGSDFNYGAAGRVEWVITEPDARAYQIRFRTVSQRPLLGGAAHTPPIGTGDLLRYNAGAPRPLMLPYPAGLVDLTGDGMLDLVGCWNYAHRPGEPWDGIVCYPRLGASESFTFGDMIRLRYLEEAGTSEYKHFLGTYMTADFADLNGDGLVDIVFSPRNGDFLHLMLNTGARDEGGMPVFTAYGAVPRPPGSWFPCRVVDLNRDGALDIVLGCLHKGSPSTTWYLRNTNPAGWPFQMAPPERLMLGKGACFFDVDEDGLLDAIALEEVAEGVHAHRIVWQHNLGGNPPRFDAPQPIAGITPHYPNHLVAVTGGHWKGFMAVTDVFQSVAFFEHSPGPDAPATFRQVGRAESLSAVMALGDQAWPWVCDWNGNGALDLLIGNGYGWPRIVLNEGTAARPAYSEPQPLYAEGRPIRILRNEVLGEPHHSHNMGYPYPVFMDWDMDGLPDLLLPNETNRIFWHQNTGSIENPQFGPRQQILVEQFPDSDRLRAQSAQRALNATYPSERDQPFFWRTGAAFADWNGDGLTDIATLDGNTRKLTLFVQYMGIDGQRRLLKDRALRLTDGRFIDDSLIIRNARWTESFRAVDWDRDGHMDLIYSVAGSSPGQGSIYLLRNVGSARKPIFDEPRMLRCFGEPIRVSEHGPHPWAGDFDGDGYPDLVTCTEWSVYPFYSHAAIEMDARPEFTLGPLVRRTAPE